MYFGNVFSSSQNLTRKIDRSKLMMSTGEFCSDDRLGGITVSSPEDTASGIS